MSHFSEGVERTISQGCHWNTYWWCWLLLKCFCGLWLLLRCLLSDRYGNLFSKLIIYSWLYIIYIFLYWSQGFYLHINIIKHCNIFLHNIWQNKPYQWKVLSFALAIAPRVFISLIKCILFLCWCKGFCLLI